MRYLGNKESMMSEIKKLLDEKGLMNRGLSFFDAFCGSGSVSDALKDAFDLIINDNLCWSVVYAKGRIAAQECRFEKLGFDPFDYLNSNTETLQGFIYENYSPGGSKRMYFTADNAGRIDYFRHQIEHWKNADLLSDIEYSYLLACLIESVSDVSNTAGVYGAFLKKWDSRAVKPIVFNKVDSNNVSNRSLKTFNDKIENIIEEVECDVLYLDPPYTQNQYGTQYHLLETLVLNDNPSISPITGSRSTAPMRSDWSKEYKTNILFDRIIAKTKARYIVFSYNNDGFMSKDFIEASMKRYGKPETYICKKISYKKYQNFKSQNKNEHFEYLFFVEKKSLEDVYYESPLNYIGSKAKVVGSIKKNAPKHFTTFVDAFGGGFNVGVNMNADRIIYNDINCFVEQLVKSFKVNDTYQYLLAMRQTIKKFGLERAKSESYNKARQYYNSLPKEKRDPKLLFTIILYGFHQQIRFNSNHDFNNPAGIRWFNDKVLEKMISFSRALKEKDFSFKCGSYLDLSQDIDENTFVYMDPPYTLTTGTYNDGKRGFDGWSHTLEKGLFDFADQLNARGIPFMLSYVLEHGGKKNEQLETWIKEKGYRLISLGEILGISGSRRKEVLIVNYDELA